MRKAFAFIVEFAGLPRGARSRANFPLESTGAVTSIKGTNSTPCWLILGLFLFGALFCAPANAVDPSRQISQYGHTAWRVQDGVFSGSPYAITQTADGYLWIGTQNGLLRFDGVRFAPWTPPGGETLPGSAIYSLLGASDGSLWIGTGNGLAHWANGALVNYSSIEGRINSIVEDQHGRIWMAQTRQGAKVGPVCSVTDGKFRCYSVADGVNCRFGAELAVDKQENVWIGSPEALCRWIPGSSSIYLQKELKQSEALTGVSGLAAGEDGSLWVGIARVGKKYGLRQLVNGVMKSYVVPGMDGSSFAVNSLFVDRSNDLWVGTLSQGIYRVHDGKADHFRGADGLSSDSVQNFYQDREGNLWVVTSKGIDCFHDLRVASFSVREGLTAEGVASVLAARDGTVWIGNEGALDLIRGSTVSHITQRDGLPGHDITSLLEDHTGSVWVGVDGGLSVYEHQRFRSITRSDGRPVGAVVALTEDTDHNIWAETVGSFTGLVRIRDQQVREEIPASKIPRATGLAADPKGGIWLALNRGGAAQYRNGHLDIHPVKEVAAAGKVRNLLIDPDGTTWAASSFGLIQWKDGKAKLLSSRNGLPCDSIITLVRDNLGSIWLSTDCGFVALTDADLERWSKQPDSTVHVRILGSFDGAQPAYASFTPEASRSADGRLWFANDSILQMIDPSRLAENANPPPVHIEQIVADRKNYSFTENLHLPPHTRDLEIDYTGLSFVVPQEVRFRYKLEGRDTDWQDSQTRRQAFYTDLRPGNYKFRVIACNNDGVWNEAGATLDFTIAPTFYQTRTFLFLCATVLIGLFWFGLRLRIRYVAATITERAEVRAEERVRIARDLHDTLLQGVQGLTLHFHVAAQGLPEGSHTRASMERALATADRILVEGRDRVTRLRTDHLTHTDLTAAFAAVAADLNHDQRVRFVFKVDGRVEDVIPAVLHELYYIAREAITNAFRHSKASEIAVNLKCDAKAVVLKVSDNGCGFDPIAQETNPRAGHWGLAGMKERAQAVGGLFECRSGEGKGTQVTVTVPGRRAYRKHSSGAFGVRVFGCVLALFAMLLVASPSQGEPLQLAQLDHASWTSRDGAPLGIIFLQQDKDGPLWLVAQTGLYNFDGITFSPFQSQPRDPQLPSTTIRALYVSRRGVLWVGFGIKGIAEIREHRVVRLYDEKDGLPVGTVTQIFEAPGGTMMAVARNRLVQLNSDRWEESQSASSLLGEEVRGCFFDRTGTLWLATQASIWQLPPGQQHFQRTSESGGTDVMFAESADGGIWLRASNPGPAPAVIRRLFAGPKENDSEKQLKIDAGDLLFDRDGLFWIATQKGILRIRPDHADQYDLQARDARDTYSHPDGLTSDSAISVLQDSSGDIWFGTTAGLDRFRKPNLVRFINKRLAETPYFTLAECPSTDLWVGIYGKPLLSVRGGEVLEHKPIREPVFAHCDLNGTLWLSDEKGLFRYQGDQIQRIPPPAGVQAIQNREVVGDNDHLLFVSFTRNGLWRYTDGTWSRVTASGFPYDTPFSLFMDSRKRLWTGYIDNRIAVLDGKASHIYTGDPATPVGIVEVFLESQFGLLIGGSNGISVLQGDHLVTLPAVNPSNVQGISGLLQASNGDLWLNGLHGVVRISAQEVTKALRSPGYRMSSELFSEAGIVGPSSQVFGLPTAVEDSRGLFWFATSNTLVSVDPKSIRPSTTVPILSGLSMTVDGSSISGNRQVPPGFHTVRIKYLGAHITAPGKVTYKYKLDGLDKGWQDVGNRAEAVYTGLRPGAYRFAVMASNGEGTWSQPDNSLQFSVLPSFYQTEMFWLLCVTSLIGLVWLGLRLRISYVAGVIRERAEVRADERVRIARDLHDTLLQGVQGLTLRFHVAAQELPEGNRTRESMERALETADRILVEGRYRVTRLRTDHLTYTDLIDAFEAVAADLNHEQRVRFVLKIEGRVEAVTPAVLHELYSIGREAISNAFRHSRASEIAVNLRCDSKAVVLAVSDNGSGFDPVAQEVNPRTGHWGLAGMKERARAVGGLFECRSGENQGTQVTVTIPGRRAFRKR
jgi:signal transduction histidine kinase/ligand-binding sensor domain-containing protein